MTTTTRKLDFSKLSRDHDKMSILSNLAAERAEEIFDELGVDYHHSGNKLVGYCPVHGGNNVGAFNLYPDGYVVKGWWKCRTHGCQQHFKPSFLGCIRGILSHQKHRWSKKGDKMITFAATVKWVCEYLNIDSSDIKVDEQEMERSRFISQVYTKQKAATGITRDKIRASLIMPCEYYINRGYKAETLDAFDVGLCMTPGREMYGRAVAPIYDNDGNYMVGCTGRSIYPVCGNCKLYHDTGTDCPSESERWKFFKWKHNKGFIASEYLYGYWLAKQHIQETRVVILVEGPGDVWRLFENGIYNAVAIFGTDLSPKQQMLLECSGAMSVIVMMDNDDNEAGQKAAQIIKDKLERGFRLYFPRFSAEDAGSLQDDEVTDEVKPFIDSVIETRKM